MEDKGGITAQGYPLLSFDQTIRFLSNPKASDVRASGDIFEHGRLLSLIYDSIQRLTEANRARVESYYPTDKEIYEDIQLRKRAISDRAPMPPHGEMMKVCLMMAELNPPPFYILREYAVIDNRLRFITKFVASTEHESGNRVSDGLHHVIHNTIATIKTHLIGMDFNRPLQEKIAVFSRLEDLPGIVRLGRMDQILSDIYLRKSDIEAPEEKDVIRLQKVNHFIREHVFRPVLVELTKSRITVKVGLDPLRKSTGRPLPDVILFNNLNSIRFRSKMIVDLLVTKPVLKAVEAVMPQGFSVLAEKDDREKISQLVAEKVVEAAKTRLDLPDALVEICAERIALDAYMKDLEKQDQVETDRQEMQKLLQLLKQQKGVFRAKSGHRLTVNERLLDFLVRGLFSGILIGTEPPYAFGAKNLSSKDFQSVYLLLKDREATARAIDQAEELHEKTQDVVLVRLIEQMTAFHEKSEAELKEIIAPAYIEKLRRLVATTYLPQLPLFQRLWLTLKGRLPDSRIQKRLWEQYVAQSTRLTSKRSGIAAAGKTLEDVQGGPRQNKLDERMQIVLGRMADIAAMLWEKGQFPDRKAIMTSLPSQEDRAVAERLFGFIKAGAASTRDIIEIQVPHREAIYASRRHFENNLSALRERFQRRMADFEGHETKEGVKLSMKHRTEEKEVVRAIVQTLNGIGAD
ncbi:hypothetical protein [Leptonema illini]|uniref:Uncharacterized protein n=1 Tax=Leptonema illini DSM 21528 TaxID=929563 RepID=H2CK53_9LEPT|nr:hypothetical protein [Leptonema illini]EHQ07156.1 hypothetical protein Lepil_2481 [Leptonema illini DSM 21528]